MRVGHDEGRRCGGAGEEETTEDMDWDRLEGEDAPSDAGLTMQASQASLIGTSISTHPQSGACPRERPGPVVP